MKIARDFLYGIVPLAVLALVLLGTKCVGDVPTVNDLPMVPLSLAVLAFVYAVSHGPSVLASLIAAQFALMVVLFGTLTEPYDLLLARAWPALATMTGAAIGLRYPGRGAFEHGCHTLLGFGIGIIAAWLVSLAPHTSACLFCLIALMALMAARLGEPLRAAQSDEVTPPDDERWF